MAKRLSKIRKKKHFNSLDFYSNRTTPFPFGLRLSFSSLDRLYLRPDIVIRRQDSETPPTEVDDEIKSYNYDNPDDNENYCPNVVSFAKS